MSIFIPNKINEIETKSQHRVESALLFQVPENSLVLIDEPELSLHVIWQEQFLSDLEEIANLSKFQAILATHSPQIIGDRWDLTVELNGPISE